MAGQARLHLFLGVALELADARLARVLADHDFERGVLDRHLVLAQAEARASTKGSALEGHSLAELAQKLGINPEALQATITQFNRYAADGKDPDFHISFPLQEKVEKYLFGKGTAFTRQALRGPGRNGIRPARYRCFCKRTEG